MENKTTYKKDGIYEDEIPPFKYFISDNDSVFVADILGNEFIVLADMTLKPVQKGTVKPMWREIPEIEAKELMEKEYQKDKWIMLAHGERLERYIHDYKGVIWLGDYQGGLSKSDKGYRSTIILDDGMGYPANVAYFEDTSIDELKTITEREMTRRANR